MIFGANCSEDSVVVQRFVSYLFKEISAMEKQSYSIGDREIKFSEFPNVSFFGWGASCVC